MDRNRRRRLGPAFAAFAIAGLALFGFGTLLMCASSCTSAQHQQAHTVLGGADLACVLVPAGDGTNREICHRAIDLAQCVIDTLPIVDGGAEDGAR